MNVRYEFVNYGEVIEPRENTLVLDVGMNMVPGVIDHHHPKAEAECAASLIVKHPDLVLDHLLKADGAAPASLTVVTHRLPDFDASASVFLALKLLETKTVDRSMERLAGYARMADSASFPKSIDLAATPYAILRALSSVIHEEEDEASRRRMDEGLRMMSFLYDKAELGLDIVENRTLFAGIDRFERAMRRIESDYFRYLEDRERGRTLRLWLPHPSEKDRKELDGLAVSKPRSFLFKEWARRDIVHSSLRKGYVFVMSGSGRDRFLLGVDPEEGVTLEGLAVRLDLQEGEKRSRLGMAASSPWYGGDCAFFKRRIVASPREGTVLSHEEVLEAVLEFGARPDRGLRRA
ncbi:MAG: hypothetical protein JW747_02295 [Candidatus Aminicenantes bacterium]|nr:hypothetical protein [Candidatus Aminicenantes bacterium]